MKKKLKLFLLIVLILLLAVAGTLLYIFKFKKYDVADVEVEQIVEDPYAIELPDGTVITTDGNQEVVEGTPPVTEGVETPSADTPVDGSATDDSQGNNGQGDGTTTSDEKQATADKGSGMPAGTNKQTVASIKQKYVPTLVSLQSQADSRLNTLVGRAKKEYSDKKANGESISYGYFYNKYAGAATGLEANTDAVFAGVIKALENDLSANGYDKSYAQSFVDDYNATKKARRDSLLSKAVGQ